MEQRKFNMLGEEWTLKFPLFNEDPKLKQGDGYCDHTTRTIVVEDMKPEPQSLEDLDVYKRSVIRHELIHAFLDECGLKQSSNWARNEEMVDFFAIQLPKLIKLCIELEVDK